MDFDNYDLDPAFYDEMFLQDGTPREHCQQLYETLTRFSAEELNSIQERVARSFSNEGITFTVYGDDEADERIIPVDSIPRVMSATDWREIEVGLTQRIKALNLFLEDVYGPSRSNDRFGVPRIVDDGVIPVDVVRGCPQYRIEMRGFSAPYGTWVAICGTDLVRTNDGFKVLEDNLRVPSGVSYMLANRKTAKASLRRVDVIYRRVDDDFVDPLVFRPDSLLGVPGLIHAYKLGNVSLVNAPGTGVADDKSVYAYVPDMIRYYLSEEPILANVDTRLCRRPEDLEYTLDNLQDLVVKRVGESGGYGMLIGPHSTPEEREEYAKQVRANPPDFISQPVLDLSRSSCLIDGRFEPRHVDLRPFVLHGSKTRIVPGAFCRVALRRGSLVVNSSQGGGGKDFWVLEE